MVTSTAIDTSKGTNSCGCPGSLTNGFKCKVACMKTKKPTQSDLVTSPPATARTDAAASQWKMHTALVKSCVRGIERTE